eukprot:3350417-Amphidinium_carterae.3
MEATVGFPSQLNECENMQPEAIYTLIANRKETPRQASMWFTSSASLRKSSRLLLYVPRQKLHPKHRLPQHRFHACRPSNCRKRAL